MPSSNRGEVWELDVENQNREKEDGAETGMKINSFPLSF